MSRRPPNHSRAWVDAVVCPVLVDIARVEATLPVRRGLRLRALPDVPEGLHPVIVEIWRVHDGTMETGGMDAHDWSELAATAAGFGVGGSGGALAGAGVGSVAGAAGGGVLGMLLGPVGLAWGAAIGAAAGATTAAGLGATAGAMWGARWAGGVARRVSVTGSRVLGSYSEILVTIPGVQRRSGSAGSFSWVAAMHSDSALSRFGDRVLGFGYDKQPARISVDDSGHVSVQSRTRARLLSVTVAPPRSSAANTSAAHVRAALDRPLLGARSASRLAVSFLDRAFDAPSVRLTATTVTLEGTRHLLDGLLAGPHRISANTTKNPWGAFLAAHLPVRLSYPRRAT